MAIQRGHELIDNAGRKSADGYDMFEFVAKLNDTCDNVEYISKDDGGYNNLASSKHRVMEQFMRNDANITRYRLKVPRTADGLTREEFIAAMAPDCSNVEVIIDDVWHAATYVRTNYPRIDDDVLCRYRIKPATPKHDMSWVTIGAFVVDGNDGVWAEIIGDTVNASDETRYVVRWKGGKEMAYTTAKFQEKFRPGKLVPYDTMGKWIAAIKKHGAFVVCTKNGYDDEWGPVNANIHTCYGIADFDSAVVHMTQGLCMLLFKHDFVTEHFRWADDNSPIGDVVPA